MNGFMIQICPNYNPFNLVQVLFKVIVMMNDGRLVKNPTTTRTHWQCEVRMNEMMNEQIFLHWLPSKEQPTSMLSVQWFWRVVTRLLIDVDIPQLSSDGIQFSRKDTPPIHLTVGPLFNSRESSSDAVSYDRCFSYIYSLQSSSISFSYLFIIRCYSSRIVYQK